MTAFIHTQPFVQVRAEARRLCGHDGIVASVRREK